MKIQIARIGVAVAALVPASAYAAGAACLGVGAFCTPSFGALNVLSALGPVMLSSIGGISVLMVVYGGVRMILNFGDEGAIATGRKSIIYALAGLLIALASSTITQVVFNLTTMGGSVVPRPDLEFMSRATVFITMIFNTVFAIIVIFTAFRLIAKAGSGDELSKAKTTLAWAIIGAIIVNAAYAIVNTFLNLPL